MNARQALQRGAALLVGMIVLVLITLVVVSGFALSMNNLRMVGNMQFGDESAAAANAAIEQIISSPFTDSPAATSLNVDLNSDGVTDYVVAVAIPRCVQSKMVAVASKGGGSSSGLGVSTPGVYQTVWEIDAEVTEASSGSKVKIRQGVRMLMSKPQHDAACV